MSGENQQWDEGPMHYSPSPKHEAPKPDYHWLEKKRGDRIKLAVKWLAVVGILSYIALRLMGVIH